MHSRVTRYEPEPRSLGGAEQEDELVAPCLRVSVVTSCLVVLLALTAVVAAQSRPSPRASAPVDLTGYWVSVVSEDWQWRMFTPPKGDYASVPLNPEGTRVANSWNPEQDGSCRAYGAAALLRMPTRLRISWDGDATLKIETDAGEQTRRLRFEAGPPSPTFRDRQGYSIARWDVVASVTSSGADGGALTSRINTRPWGSLRVVTTNMQGGWLRRNGVPYSENAVMTEHFDRFSAARDEWFTVTTMVEDPRYLTAPFIISSNFKREPDGSRWNPTPCKAG
jgi:hypothetical protein